MGSVAGKALGAGGQAAPIEPLALATELFGDRVPLVDRYLQWLAGAGVERGLLGPRETDRLWQRHILNCAAISPLIAPESTVVDVGSGAGLPGLVLALARPDLELVLVESMSRRTAFLEEVITDLGLDRVVVRRARAEELRGGALAADVVTARAVAPIDRLVRWALPLLAPTGVVLAIKGETAAEEVTKSWPLLARSGFAEGVLFSVHPQLASVGSVGCAALSAGSLVVVEEAQWGGAEPADDQAPDSARDQPGIEGQLARVVALYRRQRSRIDRPTFGSSRGLG